MSGGVTKNIEADNTQEVGIEFGAIIADFRRYLVPFGLVFAVVFGLVLAYGLSKPKEYTAQLKLMIDPRTVNAAPGEKVLSDMPSDTTSVDTEAEVLKSAALAERFVAANKLETDPEFNPYIGQRSKFFGLIKTSPDTKALTPGEIQSRHQVVVGDVLSNVDVKRVGLTRIITVSFTSKSASKAATLANAWVQSYLDAQVEAQFDTTKQVSGQLDSRLEDMRKQVETAEQAVQQYRIANNLMTADGDSLTEQELSSLNQQLVAAKANQAEAEARLAAATRQVSTGSSGENLGEALNSTVIQNLRNQYALVSRQIADMESRYGPMHPDIIKAKREAQDINNQIQAELKRIINNLQSEVQVTRERTASIQRSVNASHGSLVSNYTAQVKLNDLERDAKAARVLYESYLARAGDVNSQTGMSKSAARVVAAAKMPTSPSSPKVFLAAAIAFVAGFAVAAIAVILMRALDASLTSSRDIETKVGQPYLVGLPLLSSVAVKGATRMQPTEYLFAKPLSVFAESYRSLRATLLYKLNGEKAQIIAVTSALPGEGKTTTSMCLSIVSAMAGQSVLLVDCDLRRRSLNKFLEKTPEVGLLEVLAGTARLEDAIVDGPGGKFKVLPLTSAATTEDVFGSEAMDELLKTLRKSFELIILDTAPVLPVVDTRILARKVDVMAVLVRWRTTPRQAVQGAVDLLLDAQAPIKGIALSCVDVKAQAKYAYGDSSSYYKSYSSYYTEES